MLGLLPTSQSLPTADPDICTLGGRSERWLKVGLAEHASPSSEFPGQCGKIWDGVRRKVGGWIWHAWLPCVI